MNSGDPARANRSGHFWLLGVSPNFTEWPLGLPRLFLCSLGYRLGIAFDHFGTAFAFGPAGAWALGWGRGVVGGWAGAGWQSNLMKGRRFADYAFQAGGPRASVKRGMVLCWDCRCDGFWRLVAVRQHLEVSAVLVQRLPEGT